ncbi:MAG: peptidase domain-containing ABC transporter [Salinivirgaceae bacterium]|jgi:ATP-binding cassette subfamily B protein|nr:peptidase domain-containing ABC transporter [Salinivirgaceae bacterium]
MPQFQYFHQPDAMDCGAACLRMIAKYYGKDYTLETLRDSCYTAKDGVSLLSISRTAEELGLKTIGGRISFQKLVNEAPLPCLLHWNQEHFVVLHKVEKSKIGKNKIKLHIADPGKGLLTYTEDEFKQAWLSTQSLGEEKGVALLFEPTEAFYNQQDESAKTVTSIKFIAKYFWRYRRFFLQLILSLLFASALQLMFPFLTQNIVDIGIKGKNLDFIYLVLIAQMMLIVSRMAVSLIRRWILLHISVRINLSLISDFFIKLMKLPMKFFDTKLTGDILQRISDHSRVENFLTSRTLETFFSFFTLVVFGIVLFIYSVKIFIVFVIGSVIYTAWIFLFLKKRRVLDFKFFEQNAKSQSSTYQLISGMQEIKLQNYEMLKRWEWEDIQADLFKLNVASLRLQQAQSIGTTFIEESKNIIITIVAATAVINGEMTLGMMLATQYIIGQLSLPISQMVNLIHDFQDTKISLERINEIHHKENENTHKQNIPFTGTDTIYINNLMFQYEGPDSPKVLNNINLTIPKGKVTAIVGASGSGKTTLIKLLLQYYNPIEGEIKIGNHNLQDMNCIEWRKMSGSVMQEGFIFSETIAQNIAMQNLGDIDKERLQKAAETANIHEFIMSMPLKYNTVIGGEGQNLSQGQQQRLLIARAVYKNPDFLFFDEATNALDANNEKAIVENLQAFYKGKTVIIVAHRLSTVKNSDQIVVLDKGEIVEVGTHKALAQSKGAYYELVKNQLELGN